MDLETDTHVLKYFQGRRRSSTVQLEIDDPPYFTLTDKRRPDLAAPQPLTAEHELTITPSSDPELMRLQLAGEDIGQVIKEQQGEELDDFVSLWQNEVSDLLQLHPPLPSNVTHRDSEIGLRLGNSYTDIRSLSRELRHTSIADIRDRQLADQRSKFLIESPLRIKLITWNAHGDRISKQELRAMLEIHREDDTRETGTADVADFYVLSLQESDPLGKNLYANAATLEETTNALLRAVSGMSTESFEELAHNQLLGMMTVVVVRSSLKPQISSMKLSSTGTGLFGVWGNKGAISISFSLGADPVVEDSGIQVALINCHLSAGATNQNLERRRWELKEISAKFNIESIPDSHGSVIFDSDAHELSVSDTEDLLQRQSGVKRRASDTPSLSRKDRNSRVIVLMGDLNFRVAMHAEFIEEFVQKGDYDAILLNDTLSQEMKGQRVLQGFKEGRICFPPTYRYQVGSLDEYDADRVPSYTDRILYSGDSVIIEDYAAHREYILSDHKPVSALLRVNAELVDFDERSRIVAETLKELDRAENAARPIVTADPTEIALTGHVLREQTASFTLQQLEAGKLVEWFIISSNSTLLFSPSAGSLPAGATQTVRISTTLQVGQSPIHEVVIVRVKDVQDIFVEVQFSSLPTCLGASLDLLCRMPDGARNGLKDQPSTNMPREIFNCVDYLWSHVLVDMFLRKGDEAIQEQVQEWMDDGKDFDTHLLDTANSLNDNIGIYSVAQELILLLTNVSGGIVPLEYYSLVQRGAGGVNVLLESLTSVNVNVLLYVCGFLAHAIEGGAEKSSLLGIFEPLLISKSRGKDTPKSQRMRLSFLDALIFPEN